MLELYVQAQTWIAGLKDRVSQDEGATAVEYGLIVALIAAIIITVVATLGTEIQDAFQTVVDNLTGATP
ncbi:MAG: Flp family type IVb pilin [Actinomycetota bacterium]